MERQEGKSSGRRVSFDSTTKQIGPSDSDDDSHATRLIGLVMAPASYPAGRAACMDALIRKFVSPSRSPLPLAL